MHLRKNKKFNILHVVSRLPVGGVETMIFNEISGYDSNLFNVSVCCMKEGGEIADALMKAGYNVVVLNRMQGHGLDWRVVKYICRLMKKNDVHILRTHQYHANLYGRLAGILAGIPVMVASFHNVYDFPNKAKLHRSVVNFILSLWTDSLVACSKVVAADMVKYDRVRTGKIKVIYNGIGTNHFATSVTKQEARKVLHLPDNELIIGTVGRLDEQKGQRYLIKAAQDLKDTCIAIAGDGPLYEELKGMSGASKAKIVFMGMLMPEHILLFTRAIDIFCFPSLWEGFGIAVAEAMAAGLPVVVSDIPPLREVVGEAGMRVPPGDPHELSDALRKLINDPQLRASLGKKARERAGLFSLDNSGREFEVLFEKLLQKKGML